MKRIPTLLLDAGTGNLHSVFHTLRSISEEVVISESPEDILVSDRIILPGVGAFAVFMAGLNKRNLVSPILEFIKQGKPVLGICVGMQALFEFSEEDGIHAGLNLLPGKVVKFNQIENIKIPHTGWNQLWFDSNHPILQDISPGDFVYFNHSYYCQPKNESDMLAWTDYGSDFCSIVYKDNVFGVQFHPEKSHVVGQKILKNFIRIGNKS
jgi:glutamine amidotransferase